MTATLQKRLKILVLLNIAFAAVFIANIVLDGILFRYGIQPRNTHTWWHIFTSPFIHGSWQHLLNNMLSFSIMASICLLRPLSLFFWNSLGIIAIGGALVWAFGRDANHIGASGWIFGLWSLVIATAWFNRKFIHILIAIAVIIFQGGMVFGLIPGNPKISYEAHIFGAIAGVMCAAFNGRRG